MRHRWRFAFHIDIVIDTLYCLPMSTVTVSSKYQIVVPKEMREKLAIKPGTRLEFMVREDHAEVIRVPSVEEMVGCLKGMQVVDSEIRDKKDRAF